MRTTFFNLFVLVAIINFSSCSTDDDSNKGFGPEPELSITFNMETAQDQMGDFADNAMAIFDGKVWSFGGENDYAPVDGLTDRLWNSSNGENWSSVATSGLTAQGRRAHTMTHFNGRLYIIGGENAAGTHLNDIWYSDDGTTWTFSDGLSAFGIIVAHQTLVFNGRMYIIAGDLITGNTKVLSTLDGTTWTLETSNAFSGRGGHKALVYNNAIYVIGGEDIANTRLGEIWTSTDGSTWSQVTTSGILFSPRGGHTATVYNGKAWIIGGRDDSSLFKNDIWYSSNMTEWTQYDGIAPFDAITGHKTLRYNDALWVFGGNKSGGNSGAIWSIKED
jgi:N-acetylneuraminic acid mutarotase